MKTTYQCRRAKNMLTYFLPCREMFQLIEVKYTYLKKLQYCFRTTEEVYSYLCDIRRFSLTKISELLRFLLTQKHLAGSLVYF